jgi:hypothetical protein
MSDWKERILAQIIVLRARADYLSEAIAYAEDFRLHMDAARSLQALLDLAVAAEQVHNNPFTGKGYWLELTEALDKLREASDE